MVVSLQQGTELRGDRMSFVITQPIAPAGSADAPRALVAVMSSGNVFTSARHDIITPHGLRYAGTKILRQRAKYPSSATWPSTHALSMCGRPTLVRDDDAPARPRPAGTRGLP